MARTYDDITDHLREWVARQPMFFVASAPLDGDGHVNVSPKGPIGSLRILDDHRVAYLDIARQRRRRRSPTCARTAGSS